MINLNTKIEQLNRVGVKVSSILNKLDIYNVKDLLFYFPFRYDDFSRIYKISELKPAMVATIKGTIELINNRRSPKKRKILTEAVVVDDTGSIKSIWFNQPYLTKNFKPGDEVYLSGKISYDYHDGHFLNPVCEKVKNNVIHTARVVPIYSLTEKLTQKQLRFLISQAIIAADQVQDWLPETIAQKLNLPNLPWSLKQIHFPDDFNKLKKAADRLKFNELFLLQLKILQSKKDLNKSKSVPVLFHEIETKEFVKNLPFELTGDQKKAAWKIIKDIGKNRPMNRLLEGDVGSGKTVVAALAIFNAAKSGGQSVFMAPTEILAKQHYGTFSKFFSQQNLSAGLLTGSESLIKGKKIKRNEIKKMLTDGEIDLLIGTHAVIQEKICFKNLVLAIVDEQHRFGVEQRKAMKSKANKGITPHLLSMTATPIPRSLSLVFFGDLDFSIIKEMPEGRKKVIVKIVGDKDREDVYGFIKSEINKGRQVFVVCPLIDASDKLGVKSVTAEFEKLDNIIFKDIKIDFLHGKMSAQEKEKRMNDFLANITKIMVTTSVVEVGVDVPNASVMMIEGAERFGLAQLYQLKGRVGRSEHQSYCFIFASSESPNTIQRLKAIVESKDCFELAEFDLRWRGPGEIFGTAQSGFADLKVATLNDYALAQKAKEQASEIIEKGEISKHPLLKKIIFEQLKQAHFE